MHILAPTGALAVAPLNFFYLTFSRSSKSHYNLLTLLKFLAVAKSVMNDLVNTIQSNAMQLALILMLIMPMLLMLMPLMLLMLILLMLTDAD